MNRTDYCRVTSAIQAHARGETVAPFPPNRRHEFELAAVRVSAVLASSARVGADLADRLAISATTDLMDCVFDITDPIVGAVGSEGIELEGFFRELQVQFAFRDMAKSEDAT